MTTQTAFRHRTRTALPPPGGLDLFWSPEFIAAVSRCPQSSVEENWPRIARALDELGIYDRDVAAATIGTVAIETASTFEPVTEAYWLSDSWRWANLRYAPYWGRGFVQTTWLSNYQRVQNALGIDCVNDPDLLLQPEHAARALALYFSDHDLAGPARRRDWAEVRYRVLGGYAGLDRLRAVAEGLLN